MHIQSHNDYRALIYTCIHVHAGLSSGFTLTLSGCVVAHSERKPHPL